MPKQIRPLPGIIQQRSPEISQRRTLELAVREVKKEERRVTVSFSSEQAYTRWYGVEILQHEADSIDLSRLNNIGVSLYNHNRDYVLGKIENARLDVNDKRTYCDIVFDNDEAADLVFQKVSSGTLKGVSVGYRVDCWEEIAAGKTSSNGRFTGPAFVATKWTPYEVSIVSIPADDSVGVGRNFEESNPYIRNISKKENEREEQMKNLCLRFGLDYDALTASGMTEEQIRGIVTNLERNAQALTPAPAVTAPAPPAETERSASDEKQRTLFIDNICKEFNVDDTARREFIDKDFGVDQVREAVLKRMSEKMKPVPSAGTTDNFRMGESEPDKIREAASDGLLLRAGVKVAKPCEGAREFRNMSLRDLAIECEIREGRSGSHKLSTDDLFGRALTPDSQLASIYTTSVNKSMAVAYQEAKPTYEAWVGVGSNRDFKSVTHYQLSEAGNLDEMSQTSEFKKDQITDNGVSKRIKTFGKSFGFTRQALINDDLSVLTKVPMFYTMAARRNRNQQVYKILGDTTLNIYDGTALFTSGHGNLAGTGATITTASLAAAKAAMRKQKGLRSKAFLNVTPSFLIVGSDLELTAAQLLRSTADPSSTNSGVANIYANSMSLIVDSELDQYDSNAWYLAASPNEVETIEITYLNGNEMPTLQSRVGFEFLGIEWNIFDDFGVTALDYRGLYKNANAS